MPKKTPAVAEEMEFRTRHLPVAQHKRLKALAALLDTTIEDIMNQAIEIGLDWLEGKADA